MISPEDVVREARTWVGTPFHHQGRRKAVGVDCAGVCIGVANELGLSEYDIDGYSEDPRNGLLDRILETEMDRIDIADAKAGDWFLMAFGREPQHLAMLTDIGTIIHAYKTAERCIEHSLDSTWKRRIRAAYRYSQ